MKYWFTQYSILAVAQNVGSEGLKTALYNTVPFIFSTQTVGFWRSIVNGRNQWENCGTESIAIGSSSFVEETKIKLGIKAIGRSVEERKEDQYMLREEPVAYNSLFDHQKGLLSSDNSCFLDLTPCKFDC